MSTFDAPAILLSKAQSVAVIMPTHTRTPPPELAAELPLKAQPVATSAPPLINMAPPLPFPPSPPLRQRNAVFVVNKQSAAVNMPATNTAPPAEPPFALEPYAPLLVKEQPVAVNVAVPAMFTAPPLPM
jgi:hypothetical protein